MLQIPGKRIYLRDHQTEDLPAYHEWISDADVMKYVTGFPQTNSLEESFISLANAIKFSPEKNRTKYFLAIISQENNEYNQSFRISHSADKQDTVRCPVKNQK